MEDHKNQIVLEWLLHRGQECVAIRFPYNSELTRIAKQIPEVRFSNTNKCWYVVHQPPTVDNIISAFEKHKRAVDHSRLRTVPIKSTISKVNTLEPGQEKDEKSDHRKILRVMEQKLHLKGYSSQTVKTYVSQFGLFLKFFGDASPTCLSEAEIRNYLLYIVERKKVSRSTQNQAINPSSFFMRLSFVRNVRCITWSGR